MQQRLEKARLEPEKARQAAVEAAGGRVAQAVLDLCEAFDIVLDDVRREHIASPGTAALDGLRVHFKAHRAWPAG